MPLKQSADQNSYIFEILTFKFDYLRLPKQLRIKSQDKIKGIHNYCDRWCERCNLRSHCEIFEAGQNMQTVQESPKSFQPDIQLSLERLYAWAAVNRIPLETIQKDSEEDFKRRQKNMTNARTNETSKLANDYRMLAMDFKSKCKPLIEQFKEQILRQGYASDKNAETILEIEFAIRTIGWYELQLPFRITQAYVGLSEYVETTTDPVQNDFNGSAKVVLIGIENSFAAWEMLLKNFPELEKQCMQALILLDRIYKRILADFPNAGLFIRPGFDEMDKSKSLSHKGM